MRDLCDFFNEYFEGLNKKGKEKKKMFLKTSEMKLT